MSTRYMPETACPEFDLEMVADVRQHLDNADRRWAGSLAYVEPGDIDLTKGTDRRRRTAPISRADH